METILNKYDTAQQVPLHHDALSDLVNKQRTTVKTPPQRVIVTMYVRQSPKPPVTPNL